MSVTGADDVRLTWAGGELPADEKTVQGLIDQAERKIRRKFPTIQDRLDAGTEPDLQGLFCDVTVEMVQRVLRNPEGYRQVQDTTGPFAGSMTYGGDHPGTLYLTAENIRDLQPPRHGVLGMVRVRPSRVMAGPWDA